MGDRYQDDGLLIARFQNGDASAMDALIQKHQARAYIFACRLTKDRDIASDVVAEAFLRIFRALSTFKGESSFTTWMYRIITNCYLDTRKKQRRTMAMSLSEHVRTDEGETEMDFADLADSPHQALERLERGWTVSEAIELLTASQKAIILMYHAEELAYEEIAEVLELPLGTVKSRLNRARLALRNLLVADEELLNVA